MAVFSISDFKSAVKNLARPNRFLLEFTTLPPGLTKPSNILYLIQDSGIPDISASKIPLPWFGREIYIPGDPKFSDFEATFRVTEDYKVVDFFYAWQKLSANKDDNTRGKFEESYKGVLCLKQFSASDATDATPTAKYYMHGAYVKDISVIDVNQESGDVIVITATFGLDFWNNSYTITNSNTIAG